MQNLVVKDNSLINASYNLSLVEQRLILLAIIEARASGKGINANDPLTVNAASYAAHFGVHRNTAYQALKDACNNLFVRQFSYQEKYGKSVATVKSRWVSQVAYIDDAASVQLIFAPAIVPLITRLEEQFTQYDIDQVSGLNSGYSVRLYEILVCWRSTGKTPMIELAELRARLGVLDDEYQRMERFKACVLEPALKQINEHTDITASYEQNKKGRKIVAFSFRFKQKPQQQLKTRDADTVDMFHKLTEKQIMLYSSKLARLPEFAHLAHANESYDALAVKIARMLCDSESQKLFMPAMKKIGFKAI